MQAVGIDDPAGYSPDAWADRARRRDRRPRAERGVAPGTERGNEVLAHVAAMLDLPMAANCDVGDARRPAHADSRPLGREPARGGAAARLARHC